MSYYLKYRPQKISELDLDGVRSTLLHILTSNTFSHAYLFSGPKGTGKTSSARIIAKVLNCEQNQPGNLNEPCGTCENCRQIQAGVSLGVMEMDAASNRGIDDIRELKSRVGLSPSQGRYAIYVIDEVHMLTKEAFNALLKTLEEPPEHAVFILATTEAHKIPDTIISRCTRIQYSKATPAEVLGSISKAVVGEKLKPSQEALEAIAVRSGGSFRDGMKLVEQLAQKSTAFTLDDVNELTGYASSYDPADFIKALIAKDINTALKELSQKEASGVDSQVFASRTIEALRTMLVDAATSKDVVVAQDLNLLAAKMLAAISKIKLSPIPQLPLEIASIQWCLGSKVTQPEQEPAVVNQNIITPNTSFKNDKSAIKSSPKKPVSQPPIKRVVQQSKKVPTPPKPPKTLAASIDVAKLEASWDEILKAIKPFNHSLEALLRSARPAEADKEWLTLHVFYAFHLDQLKQDKHRQIVESVISNYLGSRIKIRCELGEKKVVSAKPIEEKSEETVSQQDSQKPKQDDLAQAAEEIFGS